MFGTHDLSLFIISGLLLNMIPGPDSLLIMSRSAAQDWRAGSAAALGIGSGTLIHILAAALGLSAILTTSITAFNIVKYMGAAYLVYMGISLVLSKKSVAHRGNQPSEKTAMPLRKIYLQGFLSNVLNPKIAVFFLAFVPQFIDANAEHKAWAFIFLGLVFNFNGMLWCNFLAISSAFASKRVKTSPVVVQWLNRILGVFFVSFGVKLALNKN